MKANERLRDQCPQCPWRRMEDEVPTHIAEHARTDLDGFVCHTRMGPCDGPRIALKVPRQQERTDATSE